MHSFEISRRRCGSVGGSSDSNIEFSLFMIFEALIPTTMQTDERKNICICIFKDTKGGTCRIFYGERTEITLKLEIMRYNLFLRFELSEECSHFWKKWGMNKKGHV
jgi:hypothetical protein